MYAVTDLRYDPDQHRTWRPDGVEVPHVTAILEAVGVSADFRALAATHPRVARAIEFAAARGSAVHADCHAYDDSDLIWETVDPAVGPYIQAWAAFRKDKGLTPITRERRLYHPAYNYTGTLDGVFWSRPLRRVLVDIKTGDPEDAGAHLQTAAYEMAWNHEHPADTIDERWAVWLRPDRRRAPYSVINYTAQTDGHLDAYKWQACLTVYYEQPGRRRRAA